MCLQLGQAAVRVVLKTLAGRERSAASGRVFPTLMFVVRTEPADRELHVFVAHQVGGNLHLFSANERQCRIVVMWAPPNLRPHSGGM